MAQTLRLIAPARFVAEETIELAVERCRRFGLDLQVGAGCRLRHHQFAGTDEERARDFIAAWNGGEADSLWCARGGHGSGRILPLIRGKLKAGPKTLIGFSDQTFLLAHIAQNNLGAAVHGPMAINLMYPEDHAAVDALLARVAGGDFSLHLAGAPLETVRPGAARGRAIVGNLSVLTRLIGTPDEPDWEGSILMVEDVDEYLYAIDRLFLHLAAAGILNRIAGLCLGGFTRMQDNEIPFGATVEQMALYHLGGRAIPVAAKLPIGHGPENAPVVFGAMATLVCEADGAASLTVEGAV